MVFKGELIGSKIEVVKSTSTNLVGIKGKVVDETKNTIMLDSGKMIQKNSVWIKVFHEGTSFELDGRLLVGKPEDRLKRIRK